MPRRIHEATDVPGENEDAEESGNGFADEGFTDNALAKWGAEDVNNLVQFLPDDLDLSSAPSAAERSKEARMAVHKRTNDLIGHDLVLVAWRPQEALLKSEGTITDGFLVVGRDLTTGDNFSQFVGAIVLVRKLKRWSAPVRVRLTQRGRALDFE